MGVPKVRDGREKGEKWISWGSLYHDVIVLYLNCGVITQIYTCDKIPRTTLTHIDAKFLGFILYYIYIYILMRRINSKITSCKSPDLRRLRNDQTALWPTIFIVEGNRILRFAQVMYPNKIISEKQVLGDKGVSVLPLFTERLVILLKVTLLYIFVQQL